MKINTTELNDYSSVSKNKDLVFLIGLYENASDRYFEAEELLLQIAEMKWYQRIFCHKKIMIFLNSKTKVKNENNKRL